MIEKLLNNKPIWTKENGEQLIDLTKQNFNPSRNPIIIDYLVTTKDMQGRPDVISYVAYNNIEYTAMALKQNNYSNPFAIDNGEIFIFQDLGELDKQTINSEKETNIENFRSQYIDPSKMTSKDQELDRFSKREKPKTRRDGTGDAGLPPNIANIGDKEFTVRGGKVIFGEDVTNNAEVCDEPLSKTELINRLIKNKL